MLVVVGLSCLAPRPPSHSPNPQPQPHLPNKQAVLGFVWGGKGATPSAAAGVMRRQQRGGAAAGGAGTAVWAQAVFREGVSSDLATRLLADLKAAAQSGDSGKVRAPGSFQGVVGGGREGWCVVGGDRGDLLAHRAASILYYTHVCTMHVATAHPSSITPPTTSGSKDRKSVV